MDISVALASRKSVQDFYVGDNQRSLDLMLLFCFYTDRFFDAVNGKGFVASKV
jgi:hypothetical protein